MDLTSMNFGSTFSFFINMPQHKQGTHTIPNSVIFKHVNTFIQSII